MSWAGMLLALVGPLVIRGLLAIGFTAVTFTGVTVAVNAAIAAAQTSWAGLPATALQLCSLAGVPGVLGLIAAAFVAKMTLWVGVNASKLVFTGKA